MVPKENIHLKTLTYRIDKTLGNFSSEIHTVLGYGLGDGYSIDINELGKIIFIRIEIFGRDKHAFLVNYLENNGQGIDYPNLPVIEHSKSLLQIDRIDEGFSRELVKKLYSKFEGQIKITHSFGIYEKGASDWYLDLLLWIGNVKASVVGNYIYDLLRRKKLNLINKINIIENCDPKKVLEIASTLSQVNKNDLRIVRFYKDSHDNSSFYFITSRYVDIKITLNGFCKVIKYELDKKTFLHI